MTVVGGDDGGTTPDNPTRSVAKSIGTVVVAALGTFVGLLEIVNPDVSGWQALLAAVFVALGGALAGFGWTRKGRHMVAAMTLGIGVIFAVLFTAAWGADNDERRNGSEPSDEPESSASNTSATRSTSTSTSEATVPGGASSNEGPQSTTASTAMTTTTQSLPPPPGDPNITSMTVSCAGWRPQMRVGEVIHITYTIVNSGPDGQLDFGAGFYDVEANDLSEDGPYDLDFEPVVSGSSTKSRDFVIPPGVEVNGEYELVGEVFRPGTSGDEGVNPLREDNCGTPTDRIVIIP